MKKHWLALPNEPRWVPIDEVVSAVEEALNQSEENFQLLSRGLLESAMTSVQNHFHYGNERNIVELAVHLLFAIGQNHAFEQGNKRAGFFAALMLIETNGYVFDCQDTTELADLIVAFIEHKVDRSIIVRECAQYTRRAVSKYVVEQINRKAENLE